MFDGGRSGDGACFGQIWLIAPPAAGLLSDRAAAALAGADAVLYERGLAPLIGDLLPAGLYAEALPAPAAADRLARALKLAADGWRVVQLIEPGRGCRRFDAAAAELACDPSPRLTDTAEGELRVLLVGSTAGALVPAHAVGAMNGLAG